MERWKEGRKERMKEGKIEGRGLYGQSSAEGPTKNGSKK